MNAKSSKRLVREGNLAAEVDVTLLEADGGWTPYLSIDDAYKLDDMLDGLRQGLVRIVNARGSFGTLDRFIPNDQNHWIPLTRRWGRWHRRLHARLCAGAHER